MQYGISILLSGISLGGQYALIAIGYTMVYGILRLINFAHGDVFMVAGLMMVYLSASLPLAAAIPLMIILTVLLGFIIERAAYKPLRTAPRMSVMISAIGVRNVVENHVDFTQSRNLIIAGVIFVCGLGFSDGLTFTIAGTSVTLTALAVAAIAGIFLNAILPGNDYHFGKDITGDANRGIDMKPNLHEDTSYADTEE